MSKVSGAMPGEVVVGLLAELELQRGANRLLSGVLARRLAWEAGVEDSRYEEGYHAALDDLHRLVSKRDMAARLSDIAKRRDLAEPVEALRAVGDLVDDAVASTLRYHYAMRAGRRPDNAAADDPREGV